MTEEYPPWDDDRVEFFVPAATPDDIEEVYAQLAAMCPAAVPPADRRIHAIRFTHDGEVWEATVGERLRGTSTRTRRRGGQRAEVTQKLTDDATVLAIFSGVPYFVVTNARPITNIVSKWVNPFMAGRPDSVTYFDAPPDEI